MKLIVEHNGGLGDAIIDTAFIRKLKEKHPKYEIDLFTYFDNAEIFYSASYLKTIIPAPRNYNHINISDQLKNAYDKHICITGLLGWAFFTKQKGLFQQRSELYNVEASPNDMEILLDNDKLPDDIFKDFTTSVVFSAPKNEPTMSGKTIHKKVWEQIFDTYKDIVFLQIGSKDYDLEFEERDNVINLMDQISIRQALSSIPMATFVIGCDNFLNDASRVFKKKGLFLWGANDPKQYGWEQNINLYNKRHCSPCLTSHKDHTCCFSEGIDNIPFDEIKIAIEELR